MLWPMRGPGTSLPQCPKATEIRDPKKGSRDRLVVLITVSSRLLPPSHPPAPAHNPQMITRRGGKASDLLLSSLSPPRRAAPDQRKLPSSELHTLRLPHKC